MSRHESRTNAKTACERRGRKSLVILILTISLFAASFLAFLGPQQVVASSNSFVNGRILASKQGQGFSSNAVFAIDPTNNTQEGFVVCFDCDSVQFTPDGNEVVYGRQYYGRGNGIYSVQFNSTNTGVTEPQTLANSSSQAKDPILSPDGKKIAFMTGNSLNVMNADGGNIEQLANLANYTAPRPLGWSPDGTQILLLATAVVNYAPVTKDFLVNADGTGQKLVNDVIWNQAARWSPDGSKIMLVGTAPGDSTDNAYSIFTINPDGSGRVKLTDRVAFGVSWSPDGKRIAFSSKRGGTFGIYTMDADGSHLAKLTNSTQGGIEGANPVWSPDGTKIAFSGSRIGANDTDSSAGLYVMNAADGSDVQPVEQNLGRLIPLDWIKDSKLTLENAHPSSNGKIAFVSNRDGNNEIYVMNDDGTKQTRLTNNSAVEISPSWSPDGKKLIFFSDRGNGEVSPNENPGIYVMNADGSNQTLIVPAAYGSSPSFSPDGTKIVYGGFAQVGFSPRPIVATANADGTDLRALTDPIFTSQSPRWSPDGQKIVFVKDNAITIMNADGSTQTNLTNSTSLYNYPVFFPDGSKILFVKSQYVAGNLTSLAYVMNADGSNQVPLNDASIGIGRSSFSPDGKKIVLESNKDGNNELYTMNLDGSELVRLTNNTAFDLDPSWGVQQKPDESSTKAELNIDAIDLSNKPIMGIWTTIVDQRDGSLVKTGYTPLAFVGETGAEYKVSVANYVGKSFQHWDDTSTTNSRTIHLSSNTVMRITATYDTGDSLRGFTPLTYTPADGKKMPKLIVNAIEMGHPKEELHMSAIIDPLATNPSSGKTTYAIVVEDYNNTKFDHWDNGGTNSTRVLTISNPANVTAYFREANPNSDKDKNGNILVEVEPLDYTSPGNSVFLVSPNGTRIGTGCSDCQPVFFSPDNTRIAYDIISKGYPTDIFVSDVNSNVTTNLTNHPLADGFPSWSPDGTKIAFASNRNSVYQAVFAPYDVYTMNSDGTGVKRLTNDTRNEAPAGWSPDGSKLLFSREVDGAARLYIMNADGTGQQKLTDYQVYAVHWSPDGSKIFFFGGIGYNDNNVNFFVINADGSGLTKLSREGLGHFMAKMLNGRQFLTNIEWSPDNNKVAFVTTNMEDGTDSIYVMNAIGSSAPTKIADNPGTVYTTVHWSPDSTKIAFVLTDDDGKHAIYLANADGTGRTRLTATGIDNFGPMWSPDGTKIAFTSTRDGVERVYVMDAKDGSGQLKLTDGPLAERQFAAQWFRAP